MLPPHLARYVVLALAWGASGCARSVAAPAPSSPSPPAQEAAVIDIQTYGAQLAGVRTKSSDVSLSIGHDPALPGETVLLVEYPARGADPAGRDVWCDAESSDWSRGRAISFRVKPERAMRLSVSFFDRNRVVYTSWAELQGGVWQPVRVAFDEARPNPYFQPPDARVGAPIDVSDVKGIAFAPQGDESGRFSISKFVVTR